MERLKKGLFRLGLGTSLLFLFLGFYMRSVYMGVMYRTLDGYLIVLPVARLAFMILSVAALLSLARPLSEVAVESVAVIRPALGWKEEEKGPMFYKAVLYRSLILVLFTCGYFMLAGSLREGLAPLHGLGWVPLVFGLAWLLTGAVVAARSFLATKRQFSAWREWAAAKKAERKAVKAALKARAVPQVGAPLVPGIPSGLVPPPPGTPAGAPSPPAAGPPGGTAAPPPQPPIQPEGEARKIRRFCIKCGSLLTEGEGGPACGSCGWRPT